MRQSDVGWGVLAGAGLAALGLVFYRWGLSYPLLNLYGQMTFWLGVPAVFNLVHSVFGYGELAKNLAFIGAVGVWLALHPFLAWAFRRVWWVALGLAFGLYTLLGGWWAGLVYTALLGLILWGRSRRAPVRLEIEDPARRQSLKALGLLAAGALVWSWVKARAQQAARIVWDKIAGLSPEITPQGKLYYVSKNPALFDPNLKGKPYSLELGGLVEKPLRFSLEELQALPANDLPNTLTCISNPVGGDLIGFAKWTGVPLKTLLDRAGVKPQAKWLVWEAADGYRESLALAELPPEALLAYAINGEELEPRHGYPTRLLLPGRYGMKQPKWITRITLSDKEQIGYWAQRGWSRSAIIRTMSRIDVPGAGARLRAGEETLIAGVAYAGGRPLERVEVSADGGKTWQKAELKPPLGRFAWQLWALPWKPSAGEYTLQVRAVEVGERVQDATRREPLPDGATGYHTVRVRVG
ncbi:MAG: molybdopterin-binding oxidoreductase [Meiothermus sp.]